MALTLTDIACERGGRRLFEALSCALRAGDGLRITGSNGSGKTTLLRIITGLSQQYLGAVCWQGQNTRDSSQALHQDMLYLGHAPGVNRLLTPLENLRWWAALHGASGKSDLALENALAAVALAPFMHMPCHQLSAGQQRRVALARLYLSQHPLWILDEPFTAIDADGVGELEALLADKIDRGGIVILTTHHTLSLATLPVLDIDAYNAVAGH